MSFKYKLPLLLHNFYAITGFCFLMWMIFLDSNDLISRFRLGSKLQTLESEKQFYQEKIVEVKKDHLELTTNKELLEKFAREKYLMKKPKEEVFIIQEN